MEQSTMHVELTAVIRSASAPGNARSSDQSAVNPAVARHEVVGRRATRLHLQARRGLRRVRNGWMGTVASGRADAPNRNFGR
jgi:hypothetical protein